MNGHSTRSKPKPEPRGPLHLLAAVKAFRAAAVGFTYQEVLTAGLTIAIEASDEIKMDRAALLARLDTMWGFAEKTILKKRTENAKD